nr:hypothetical protein [Pandoravirus belohorizontensis]
MARGLALRARARLCGLPLFFSSSVGRTRVAALAAQGLLFFQWSVVAFGALGRLRFARARALVMWPCAALPVPPMSPSSAAPSWPVSCARRTRLFFFLLPPHATSDRCKWLCPPLCLAAPLFVVALFPALLLVLFPI